MRLQGPATLLEEGFAARPAVNNHRGQCGESGFSAESHTSCASPPPAGGVPAPGTVLTSVTTFPGVGWGIIPMRIAKSQLGESVG